MCHQCDVGIAASANTQGKVVVRWQQQVGYAQARASITLLVRSGTNVTIVVRS